MIDVHSSHVHDKHIGIYPQQSGSYRVTINHQGKSYIKTMRSLEEALNLRASWEKFALDANTMARAMMVVAVDNGEFPEVRIIAAGPQRSWWQRVVDFFMGRNA